MARRASQLDCGAATRPHRLVSRTPPRQHTRHVSPLTSPLVCAPFPRSFVTSLEKEQSEYLLAAARQRRAERTQRFLEATPGSGPGGPGPNGRPRRAVSSRELNSGSNDAYEQLRSEIQRRASARRNSARGLPTDPDGDSPVAAEPEEPASARSSLLSKRTTIYICDYNVCESNGEAEPSTSQYTSRLT